MPAFDADAWLEARRPWELRLAGKVWRAAWVSPATVMAFQSAVKVADDDQVDRVAQAEALRVLLRAMFPPRWRYVWRGDPVRLILALDEPAQGAILRDFFESLAVAWTLPLPGTTPGTSSPPPTPPPTPGEGAVD